MEPTKFKPWDRVLVMRGNKPAKVMIYSVTEKMDTYHREQNTVSYTTVRESFSAGQGNNTPVSYAEDDMFETKEDLIESL